VRLTKVTDPTTLPVARADVKDHLRIEQDEIDYDSDLDELIYAAGKYVEDSIHHTLITTQYTAKWDCFPGDILKIPGWPIASVDSIQYKDVDGATQTLSSSLYRTELVQCPATIRPAIDEDWPDTEADAIDAVTVTFTAGHGSAASDVPYQIRSMIKLLVAHWFKHREAVGSSNTKIKLAFDALRNHMRVNEWEEFLKQ
jgi:uncharacterized phiE125 gp8 family phage protein